MSEDLERAIVLCRTAAKTNDELQCTDRCLYKPPPGSHGSATVCPFLRLARRIERKALNEKENW